jgi:post-segregation antitoxin (ccd killing protein)
VKNRDGNPGKSAKRRTTLTLPSDILAYAERIARARNVNLSTVIAEALAEGLRAQQAAERSDEVLRSYRRAFSGFSETEMLLLDGVLLGQPDRSA